MADAWAHLLRSGYERVRHGHASQWCATLRQGHTRKPGPCRSPARGHSLPALCGELCAATGNRARCRPASGDYACVASAAIHYIAGTKYGGAANVAWRSSFVDLASDVVRRLASINRRVGVVSQGSRNRPRLPSGVRRGRAIELRNAQPSYRGALGEIDPPSSGGSGGACHAGGAFGQEERLSGCSGEFC